MNRIRKLLKTVWPIRTGNAYIFIIYYWTINPKDKLSYISMEKKNVFHFIYKHRNFKTILIKSSDTTSTASTHGQACNIGTCTVTAFALSSLNEQVSIKFLTVTEDCLVVHKGWKCPLVSIFQPHCSGSEISSSYTLSPQITNLIRSTINALVQSFLAWW